MTANLFDQALSQLGRRSRQLRQIWLLEGPRGISNRIRKVAAEVIRPKETVLPVRPVDVMAADLTRQPLTAAPKARRGQQSTTVNWVVAPAGAGSGGHTTMYRIVNYLQEHGYKNRIYFYDVYGADHQYYESIVRRYYGFQGPVASVDEPMAEADAVVATCWASAYPVFNAQCSGKRFYFVQDFEPSFYPVSAASVLAENTYRMGFHAITAGRWLTEKLREEFGMNADYFEFGCDTARYHRLPGGPRSGIAFYTRPGAPRRGSEIGLMALDIFAKRRPDIELHLYGEKMGRLPFNFIDHGTVTPDQLNAIYNRCFAGLNLSLTNVSLVPHEMLAAGCIPVVNDAVHNRIVLDNPYVRYAPPNPHALASELEALVDMPDFDSLSRAAAESVRTVTWDNAGAKVDAIFRRSLADCAVCSPKTLT